MYEHGSVHQLGGKEFSSTAVVPAAARNVGMEGMKTKQSWG